MVKEFVEAWDANKNKLEDYFRNTKQIHYSTYQDMVTVLFEIVINPYLQTLKSYPINKRI